MTQPITANENHSNPDVLFQHVDRTDWGLAILAWAHDDKRGYQFEDGQLRVFKHGYFDRLEPVDRPVDEATRVLATLDNMVGRERAARRKDRPMIAFDDQVTYFASLFPKGFQGVKWAKTHRGLGVRTQLKRHRNGVMQTAAQLLDPKRLEAHLAEGRADVIIGDLGNLLASTNLVTKAAAAGLDRVEGAAAERLVRALTTLLTDDNDLTTSFDAWVLALNRALHRAPAWTLVTAFPALARSDRFTAVKRTTFTCAAAWHAPNLTIKQPNGRVYLRLLDMIETITTKLGDAGLRPRDRMDVYDFIQVTLQPKAIKEITATPEVPARAAEVEAQDAAIGHAAA